MSAAINRFDTDPASGIQADARWLALPGGASQQAIAKWIVGGLSDREALLLRAAQRLASASRFVVYLTTADRRFQRTLIARRTRRPNELMRTCSPKAVKEPSAIHFRTCAAAAQAPAAALGNPLP